MKVKGLNIETDIKYNLEVMDVHIKSEQRKVYCLWLFVSGGRDVSVRVLSILQRHQTIVNNSDIINTIILSSYI